MFVELLTARRQSRVFCTIDGQTVSVGEFKSDVNRIIAFFLRLKLKKGDTLVYLSDTVADYPKIFFAASELGIIVCPVDLSAGIEALGELVLNIPCSFLLFSPQYAPIAESLMQKDPDILCYCNALANDRYRSFDNYKYVNEAIKANTEPGESDTCLRFALYDNDKIELTDISYGELLSCARPGRNTLAQILSDDGFALIGNAPSTLAFNTDMLSAAEARMPFFALSGGTLHSAPRLFFKEKIAAASLAPFLLKAILQDPTINSDILSSVRLLKLTDGFIFRGTFKRIRRCFSPELQLIKEHYGKKSVVSRQIFYLNKIKTDDDAEAMLTDINSVGPPLEAYLPRARRDSVIIALNDDAVDPKLSGAIMKISHRLLSSLDEDEFADNCRRALSEHIGSCKVSCELFRDEIELVQYKSNPGDDIAGRYSARVLASGVHKELLAVLDIGKNEPFSDSDLKLLKTAARIISDAVRCLRQYSQLRKACEAYRGVLELVKEHVSVRMNDYVVFANQTEIEDMKSLSADALSCQSFRSEISEIKSSPNTARLKIKGSTRTASFDNSDRSLSHIRVHKLDNGMEYISAATQRTKQDTVNLDFLKSLFSAREIEILQLAIQGCQNKEISAILNITTNTVKFHIKNIYSKLGVTSRVDLLSAVVDLI